MKPFSENNGEAPAENNGIIAGFAIIFLQLINRCLALEDIRTESRHLSHIYSWNRSQSESVDEIRLLSLLRRDAGSRVLLCVAR